MNEFLSAFNGAETLSSHALVREKVVNLNDFRQTNSIRVDWKKNKLRELDILSEECLSDQNSFDEFSARRAKEFLLALPLEIEAPSLSVEATGEILIEWYKKPPSEEATLFSVILGRENYIFSLLDSGTPKTHGAISYSDDSLEMIILQIKKRFGIISNARSQIR